MTSTLAATVLGGVILLGAALKALPPVWSFVKALAKMPLTLEAVFHEFSPNNGGSMRDAVDRLTTESLRGKLETQLLARKFDQHAIDDTASFKLVLSRLDEIGEP